MVLVTGPTGHGQENTVSSIARLKQRNHIMTAEDPVEFPVAGVNQSNEGPDRPELCCRVARLLRADPNIILVEKFAILRLPKLQ